MGEGNRYLLARWFGLASEGAGDLSRVLVQGLRHINEVDWRLATYIAVADQVAEQPGVVRRNWLRSAEA